MKKIISVLLVLVCLFSAVSVLALAADQPFIDAIEDEFGFEKEEKKVYAIVYKKINGSAETMYMPATSVKFDGPGYATVTWDEPIAIEHGFRCWIDEEGNEVFPGDTILVDREVILTADFYPLPGNQLRTTRVIVCALKTFIHMIQVALHIVDTATAFKPVEAED